MDTRPSMAALSINQGRREVSFEDQSQAHDEMVWEACPGPVKTCRLFKGMQGRHYLPQATFNRPICLLILRLTRRGNKLGYSALMIS